MQLLMMMAVYLESMPESLVNILKFLRVRVMQVN